MPVCAGQSVNREAYPRGSIHGAVLRGCVETSIGLPRYTKRSFMASVASQNSGPSLHKRLSFASPAKAVAVGKVELSSPSPINGRRGTLMYILGCNSFGTSWYYLQAVKLLLLSLVENRGGWEDVMC